MGVRWNPLFLVYLALFGLSLFALIIGLTGTDAARIRTGFTAPVRSVATYLIAIAVMVAAMWLAEEVGSLLSGTIPPTVLQFEAPTNIVHVFDLGLVLPAMVLAAVMLLRGPAVGLRARGDAARQSDDDRSLGRRHDLVLGATWVRRARGIHRLLPG